MVGLLHGILGWVTFTAIIGGLLALDLCVFHRRAHRIALGEALGWSAFWIALGLLFNLAVYLLRGPQDGIEYFTAYVVEKSLSVDNIFVICVIFSYFRVDARYQHRVLYLGILGAITLRATVIFMGVEVLHRLAWTAWLFGAFLIYSGVKMVRVEDDDESVHPEKNILVRLARRIFPVTDGFRGQSFFVREAAGGVGRAILYATPLLIVLLVVESADLLFAVDSIPAVLGVSKKYFIVLTSNVFAIFGLRALYFVLADVVDRFHYLKLGVCLILIFVGAKMMLERCGMPLSSSLTLTVIISVLATAAVCSVWRERRLRVTGELTGSGLPMQVEIQEAAEMETV